MGVINQLSSHVSNLIAAGEVVERPASAVKELLENAIDAHGDHITVEIRNGGISSIKITDNGVGMTRDDACACFLRHATSKIATEADLGAISTLGFRGEALAAISAVSHVELITRHRDEDIGTRVLVEAGEVLCSEDWGAPVGTTITVTSLFYNTPARMKFLKKDATEGMYVAGVMDRIALSHPEISFRFIKDGKLSMQTSGDGNLLAAIYAVLGKEFAETLVPVPEARTPQGFVLYGYVTKPERARANRNMQYFFLNERSIRNRSMGAALEEAYRDSMMVGKFPGCVLHIWTDPEKVDCNVHPAKTEVKFADERAAFESVYFTVKNAVTGLSHPTAKIPAPAPKAEPKPIPQTPPVTVTASVTPAAPPVTPVYTPAPRPAAPTPRYTGVVSAPVSYTPSPQKPFVPAKPQPEPAQETLDLDIPDLTVAVPSNVPSAPAATPVTVETAAEIPPYRLLGELFDSFIVVEVGDEALFIDKHAAHERVIYNRLLSSEAQSAPQLLMTPAVISVSKEELASILENDAMLRDIGLELEEFGGNTVIVRQLPAHIDENGIPALVSEIAAHLSKATSDRNEARDRILHTMACKAAIKAGRKSGALELDRVVRDVLTLRDVRYCPHGRPVAFAMTKAEFEKQFKRI